MKIILRKFLVFTLIGFVSFYFTAAPTFGQITEIKNSYARFNQNNLHEKIYVHTDRSSYLCGEIVWFKAYLTNAANNQPLSLSKVIYVEVLNKLHQPVLQEKIAGSEGYGSGSVFLPFSLSSGNYELRAYTNWMKNFSADNYFKKNIAIINTPRTIDSTARPASIS